MKKFTTFAYKTFHKLAQWSNPIKGNQSLRLVFLHIPKCGGSSVDLAIRKPWTFFQGQVWLPTEIDATKMVVNQDYSFMHPLLWNNLQSSSFRYMYHDLPIISGHFSFSRKAYEVYGNRYSYLTVLREPVERWISHYRFAKMGSLMHLGEKYSSQLENNSTPLKEQLEFFINSQMGFFLANLQTVALGGYNLLFDFSSKETPFILLENAKENLKCFKIVGFLENLDEFEEKIQKIFGYNIRIPHRNKTLVNKRDLSFFVSPHEEVQKKVKNYEELKLQDLEIQNLFTPEIRQRISDLCACDRELYQEAQKIFLATSRS